jgi:hypothetical protein
MGHIACATVDESRLADVNDHVTLDAATTLPAIQPTRAGNVRFHRGDRTIALQAKRGRAP